MSNVSQIAGATVTVGWLSPMGYASDRGLSRERMAERGVRVHDCRDIASLFQAMLRHGPRVVVLDRRVPHDDALAWIPRIRDAAPIGILAHAAGASSVRDAALLRAGADVLLAPSACVEVVVLTIQSLGRRVGNRAGHARAWMYLPGSLQLVSPDQKAIPLSPAEDIFLGRVLAANGAPVAKEALVTALSHCDSTFDSRRLEMLVYRLRIKVRARSALPLPLASWRHRGYVFTLPAGVD